jgi:hypothetical protein
VYRWETTLHVVHSLWIGCLFGAPLALLLLRGCEALGVALDAPTWVFVTWNFFAPGVLLVQWPPTTERFRIGRRVFAAALSTLCAWLLASVPYPTAVSALLMLALLDIVLVSLPGAPVQRLDAIATARRHAGEKEMPGLTFKDQQGLELGLGDFIIYSAFAAHAARGGAAPLAATVVGVLGGLVPTMSHITLRLPRRTVVPALPLSVALGALLLAGQSIMVYPLAKELARVHAMT